LLALVLDEMHQFVHRGWGDVRPVQGVVNHGRGGRPATDGQRLPAPVPQIQSSIGKVQIRYSSFRVLKVRLASSGRGTIQVKRSLIANGCSLIPT
jgi:hypothetical protein